jgi:uncharacterized phage-associated protein
MKFIRNDYKMAELMLYVAARSESDPAMGAVKLNKVLYHSDFRAFLELGHPITGHRYVKLPHGPTPTSLLSVRNELVATGQAEVRKTDVGATKPQERLVALRRAATKAFTKQELAIVNAVLNELADMHGMALSRDSHKEPGWQMAAINEPIPYETAFIARSADRTDIARARELAEQYGWR